MTLEGFNHLAGGIESLITVLAVIAGGVWAYRRFVRERDRYPFIEFTVDMNFIGTHGDWLIVELISVVENKGKVQHRISDFQFDLFGLKDNDRVDVDEKIGGQVLFPHAIGKGSWLPKRYGHFFIDPGTKAKYSYVARIPAEIQFVILHSWFQYSADNASHAAECTRRVPITATLAVASNA